MEYKRSKSRERFEATKNKPKPAVRLNQKKRPKTLDVFLVTLLKRAESRAKEKKRAFDLDIDWLTDKMSFKRCEATGMEFSFGGRRHPWQPSIDRIDSSGGYTRDNCQLVVLMYNMAKMDGSHADLVTMAHALVKNADMH